MSAKTLRLYFLRHGQTESFESPPFNGWRDAPLTELGRAQLTQAAEALCQIPFDGIYSSDLSRAEFGARELSRLSGRPFSVSENWREISFGTWEGLTWKEIEARDPDLASRIFLPENSDLPFPGGESAKSFYERIGVALGELRDAHPEGRVALVAHSGVCRAVWGNLLNMSPGAIWSIHQDFAALNVADIRGDSCTVRLINGYLGPEGYYQQGPGYDRIR